jgi:hypothetical protein
MFALYIIYVILQRTTSDSDRHEKDFHDDNVKDLVVMYSLVFLLVILIQGWVNVTKNSSGHQRLVITENKLTDSSFRPIEDSVDSVAAWLAAWPNPATQRRLKQGKPWSRCCPGDSPTRLPESCFSALSVLHQTSPEDRRVPQVARPLTRPHLRS